MPRMMSDPGVLLDDLRNPRQRPQVACEPAGPGTGQQDLLDLGELPGRHPRRAARRAAAAQCLLAALLPAAIPAADVLAADVQLAHDLGLRDLTGEQRRGLKADLLLEIAVARRAPAPLATALLGRHARSSHTNAST